MRGAGPRPLSTLPGARANGRQPGGWQWNMRPLCLVPLVGPWGPGRLRLNRESESKRERELESEWASLPWVRVGGTRRQAGRPGCESQLSIVCCATVGRWFTSLSLGFLTCNTAPLPASASLLQTGGLGTPTRGPLAVSGDVFGCHTCKGGRARHAWHLNGRGQPWPAWLSG